MRELLTQPVPRLLLRLAVAAVLATLLTLGLSLIGWYLDPVVPLTILLIAAAISWLLWLGIDIGDAVTVPRLDTDVDSMNPHAGDVRVRRLEDMMFAAQPRQRMTARSLGRTLGEIADERARHEDAPPLPKDLTDLIATSREEDAEAHPVRPVSRAALHRYLRILSDTGESPAPRTTTHTEERP